MCNLTIYEMGPFEGAHLKFTYLDKLSLLINSL